MTEKTAIEIYAGSGGQTQIEVRLEDTKMGLFELKKQLKLERRNEIKLAAGVSP